MKSQTEIVIETLKFYNASNRGYNKDGDHCTYHDEATGNKCAVGRCIDDSKIESVSNCEKEYIKNTGGSPNVENLDRLFKGIDNLLKPEYHGHHIGFWESLQYIHDCTHFWDEDGFVADEDNIRYIKICFGEKIADAVKEAFCLKNKELQ